ncbi:MAG TPA: hypothetical protein ENI26_04940 [Methylophaga aminisulfidivorans]|uniref:IS66 family insertion sequence element accessory protein TnpB n=1 Tax=Methylophaga aminisulfidivorans TaxID=230105 RepID=A0A7C1VNK5_9GAMM|nr:hypothetical protein [Methylophaga aminisulfidivorans]
MTYRNQDDWRQLIEEQQASGMIASVFCRERNINAKYFSLRKQQLLNPLKKAPAFIKASVKPVIYSAPGLEFKGIHLSLGNSSPLWVAHLLRELGE